MASMIVLRWPLIVVAFAMLFWALSGDPPGAAPLPSPVDAKVKSLFVSSSDVLVTHFSHWHYFQVANPFVKKYFTQTQTRPWAMFVEGGEDEAIRRFGGPKEKASPSGGMYDGRWVDVFGAFKRHVRPWMTFVDDGDRQKFDATSLEETCRAVLLSQAPWCGMDTARISEWVHDPVGGKEQRQTRAVAAYEVGTFVNDSSSVVRGVNTRDRACIAGIEWSEWPSATEPVVTAASLQKGAGHVMFRRLNFRAPMWVALRRPPNPKPRIPEAKDSSGAISGMHACMVGVRRTLPEALPEIKQKLLLPMRVQRLHVITNDDGYQYLNNETKMNDEAAIMKSRAEYLNGYARLVSSVAGVFIAMHNNTMDKLGCNECRQFFLREVCRASLIADILDGADVQVVLIFRPDIYLWQPLYLDPVGKVPSQQWHFHVKTLNYSLIADAGFYPATFIVNNDLMIGPSTLVMHLRPALPLDLRWLGDPFILGHWDVVSHWLEMFSVKQASTRATWIIDERTNMEHPGEPQSAHFFRWYFRPLMSLAQAGGAMPPLRLRLFDFMVTLLRRDAKIRNQTLPPRMSVNYAPYMERTFLGRFPTRIAKLDACMGYTFRARERGVASFSASKKVFVFGDIGRLKYFGLPREVCGALATSPGLPSCYMQGQKLFFYKKGKHVNNPCKPYCGASPAMMTDGVCAAVGSRSPFKPTFTFSWTVMERHRIGDIVRFSVINPSYLLRNRSKMGAKKLGASSISSKEDVEEWDPETADSGAKSTVMESTDTADEPQVEDPQSKKFKKSASDDDESEEFPVERRTPPRVKRASIFAVKRTG